MDPAQFLRILFSGTAAALVLAGCAANVGTLDSEPPKRSFVIPRAEQLILPRGSRRYDCGPEALAAIFAYHGHPQSVDEIAAEIYHPRLQQTLHVWLLNFLKTTPFRGVQRCGTLATLRDSIERGHPAIVMVRIADQVNHYYVVFGLSDEERSILMKDYDNQVRAIPLDAFLRIWEPTDFFQLDLAPHSDHYATALELERLKKFEQALPFYRKAIETDGRDPRAWLGLGNCLFYARQPEEALKAYRKGFEIDPQDPELANNLAWVLLSLNRDLPMALDVATRSTSVLDRVFQALQEASASAPEAARRLPRARRNLARALGTLGLALEKNGKLREAIDAYRRSFDLFEPVYKENRTTRLEDLIRCARALNDEEMVRTWEKRLQEEKSKP